MDFPGTENDSPQTTEPGPEIPSNSPFSKGGHRGASPRGVTEGRHRGANLAVSTLLIPSKTKRSTSRLFSATLSAPALAWRKT